MAEFCDVFVREILVVFVKELYASASITGVMVLYTFYDIGIDLNVAVVVGIIVVISIRPAAMRYGWNLPWARL